MIKVAAFNAPKPKPPKRPGRMRMRIRGVRSNVSVTVQADGVRQDMEGGAPRP